MNSWRSYNFTVPSEADGNDAGQRIRLRDEDDFAFGRIGTPTRRTPFTRRMPAARSGLSRPQWEASYASRRIAANLRLIVDGAYGCCSSAIRYRVTTVLLRLAWAPNSTSR